MRQKWRHPFPGRDRLPRIYGQLGVIAQGGRGAFEPRCSAQSSGTDSELGHGSSGSHGFDVLGGDISQTTKRGIPIPAKDGNER